MRRSWSVLLVAAGCFFGSSVVWVLALALVSGSPAASNPALIVPQNSCVAAGIGDDGKVTIYLECIRRPDRNEVIVKVLRAVLDGTAQYK